MIFYFTATGNCLEIAKRLSQDPISIAQEMKKDILHYDDETIGIVVPVYVGELPKIVRRFLEKATFKANYMYMILTYGMNDTVAGEWAYYYAKSQRVHIDYIHTLQMVDNYTPSFDMNEQKAIDKKVDEQFVIIQKEILERKHDIPIVTKEGRKIYETASRRTENVYDGSQITIDHDKCIGCGMCTLVCPISNFYLKNRKAFRYLKQCEFCLACVHHCLQKAIYTSISDKNPNARYINKNIKLSEIIKANYQGGKENE